MEVGAEYDGAHLTFPLSEEEVLAMLEHFKQGRPLHAKYAFQLLKHARDLFLKEGTLQTSAIAEGSKVSRETYIHRDEIHIRFGELACLVQLPELQQAVNDSMYDHGVARQ